MPSNHHTPAEIASAALRARTWLREHGGARKELHRDSSDRAAIDWFLILSHGELTARQQSETLQLSLNGIKRRRQRLYQAGRISRHDRRISPALSPRRKADIARLYYEDGYSLTGVAARCGISTRYAEKIIAQERRPRAPFLLTPEVARIFGVTENTIRLWITYGWLPAFKSSDGARAHWRWQRADLFDLVRDRRSWVAWHPAQITDPELRAFAELTRNAAGGRWWTTKQVAAYHGVAANTILTYVLDGDYLSDAECIRFGRARFFWLTGNPPPLMRRASVAAD